MIPLNSIELYYIHGWLIMVFPKQNVVQLGFKCHQNLVDTKQEEYGVFEIVSTHSRHITTQSTWFEP